jgi:hypothetical protein
VARNKLEQPNCVFSFNQHELDHIFPISVLFLSFRTSGLHSLNFCLIAASLICEIGLNYCKAYLFAIIGIAATSTILIGSVAIPDGHALDNMPELLEHFTENLLARSSVQMDPASRVVINLTRSAVTLQRLRPIGSL